MTEGAFEVLDGLTRVIDSRDEMLGTKRKPDVSACLRMVFDPGQSPPGTSIQDSEADEGIDLD